MKKPSPLDKMDPKKAAIVRKRWASRAGLPSVRRRKK